MWKLYKSGLLQLTHFILISFFKANEQTFCNRYGPVFEMCRFHSNGEERGENSGVEA